MGKNISNSPKRIQPSNAGGASRTSMIKSLCPIMSTIRTSEKRFSNVNYVMKVSGFGMFYEITWKSTTSFNRRPLILLVKAIRTWGSKLAIWGLSLPESVCNSWVLDKCMEEVDWLVLNRRRKCPIWAKSKSSQTPKQQRRKILTKATPGVSAAKSKKIRLIRSKSLKAPRNVPKTPILKTYKTMIFSLRTRSKITKKPKAKPISMTTASNAFRTQTFEIKKKTPQWVIPTIFRITLKPNLKMKISQHNYKWKKCWKKKQNKSGFWNTISSKIKKNIKRFKIKNQSCR